MIFRMSVELNKHISYRPIKKKIKNKNYCVTSSASDSASSISTVLYLCMKIHPDEDVSRFKYTIVDYEMLDANEKYFVSTYLTDFNYRHLMSKIKINKSAIADVGDFP